VEFALAGNGRGTRLNAGLRFIQLAFDSRVGCDPVNFPGFAAIIGECLLEVAGIWSDVRNHKSNQNCPAIQRFLVIELPASTIELANRRLAERTAANGREVQTPLVGLWI